MIKLVITSDKAQAVTRSFDQASVIIGGENSPLADIKLTGQSLQDKHVLITRQGQEDSPFYSVSNLANDPFVTLNNLPFGKQQINNNDVIRVGEIALTFESDASEEQPSESDDLSSANENMAEAKAAQQAGSYAQAKSPKHAKLSLKDYYLSEYDDDSDSPYKKNKEQPSNRLTSQIANSWRTFLTLFAALIGVVAVIASLFYLWISDQSGEEELRASRGIADVSMALTYAQIKNIQPQNQNWSYPEFIKNNLNAILAPEHTVFADFDAHGQFGNCPYILRIYTSTDLTYFLAIVQPSPSLLQWLFPKASIVIDSRAMEMRKILDLKALNRLIVNANNLDGVNANEIFNLVKQGELIPLAHLGSRKDNYGFVPPKALGLIRPGAENLIYNAPRYYVLGETVMNTSLNLVERKAGTRELGIVQNELSALTRLPNLVLYSSEGIQHALSAQRAFAAIAPKDKFLFAYVQVNGNGKISNSHLLMDDAPNDSSMDGPADLLFAERDNQKHKTDVPARELEQPEMADSETASNEESPAISDQKDPIFLQLNALANLRQTTLKPLAEEMIELVKKETLSSQAGFAQTLEEAKEKFEQADKEQQDKIFAKFEELIKENPHLPASKFVDLVQQTNLTPVFRAYLQKVSLNLTSDAVPEDQIESKLKEVKESKSWIELEERISQANRWMQFTHVPNEIRLIALQNNARLITTQKLNQFILASDGPNKTADFNDERMVSLVNILNAAWITDPDTHDFYIAEFEQRKMGK